MSTPTPIDDPSIHQPVALIRTHWTRQLFDPDTEAANDTELDTRDVDFYRNPLWLIAIASGCVFGAMAALLALG